MSSLWVGRADFTRAPTPTSRSISLTLRSHPAASRPLPLPPSAREDALDVLGFDRVYEDNRDLLADPEVDAASITSPNFLHHEIALAAIEAGKPFWIDKPMGVNSA